MLLSSLFRSKPGGGRKTVKSCRLYLLLRKTYVQRRSSSTSLSAGALNLKTLMVTNFADTTLKSGQHHRLLLQLMPIGCRDKPSMTSVAV